MTHTHGESTLHWPFGRIVAHLKDAHGIDIPMAWTVGQAHDAHLKAHVDKLPRKSPVLENTVTADGRTVRERLDALADEEDGIEAEAKHWYESDPDEGSAPWDDLGQESRDYYRNLVREKRNSDQKLAEKTTPQPENPQILRDRIIAALAGVDFDWSWVGDPGIGPDGRGALRQMYGEPAQRLLRWLHNGGALEIPEVRGLARDLAAAQEQLARLTTGNQRNVGSIDALEAELVEVRAERDRAIEAGRVLEDQRNDARDERDRAQQALMTKLTEAATLRDERDATRQSLDSRDRLLATRTKVLDKGRSRLREIVAELKDEQDIGLQPNVRMLIEALEDVAGGTVSTEARPIGISCKEPHLGLATTREMLEEITTRIDLGHCGLDYRTVDFD